MADWIRSPSYRWFTNAQWVQYAFEKTENENAQWNSYYGSNPKITISPGLNPDNPTHQLAALGSSECGICDLYNNCGGGLWTVVCLMSKFAGLQDCNCGICEACEDDLGGAFCDALSEFCNNGSIIPCSAIPADCDYDLTLCNIPPCDPLDDNKCMNEYGQFVDCDSEDALCNPCNGGCDDYIPCPCGEGGGCKLVPSDATCPSVCCVPGEPGCVECCYPEFPNCGIWAPDDLCCPTCQFGCAPYGYPMPQSFCMSCEYCNIDPNAEQCDVDCCKCPNSSVWITCEEIEQGACDPPQCADYSSNCYECGGSYIPIWFGCYEDDPCPNPYNPDCTTGGEEIVCYDFNTNDPIYYNPSNLGASVIIEYDNPTTGTPYGYGNVATLCSVPDSLQLCVYLVDGSGNKTQLTYETDFQINEQAATVTLESSVSVAGVAKLRFERCSDDKRMFLTFKDGAKLSAEDLNTSLHQLLFLIQEKEFASNNYYQVANDDGSGGALFTVTPSTSSPFNFNLSSVTANDVLIWDGNGSFVGAPPSQIAGNITLDNLNNVSITSATSGQFLSFNGTNWVNASLPDAETYFETFETYNTTVNAALNNYYVTGQCDTDVDSAWEALTTGCMAVPKDLIPNAITSFGLGYYAAQQQISDQLGDPAEQLPVYITNQINNSTASGGRILASFRWEIGRGEGRIFSTNILDYPVAFFDIDKFDTLDHPGTGGTLTGSDSAQSDLAYYRPWPALTCSVCKNKLYMTNIEKFLYNPSKTHTFGLEFTSGTLNPTTDRYLSRIRSVINKSDWGAALGYTEEHPLTDYPNASVQYTDQTDSMITADYQFTNLVNNGNYSNTKHVPSIVTYYLSHLWDGTGTPPSYIVWDGNMDIVGQINESGIPTDVSTYLGGSNNNWFYWRWWITGHDSGNDSSNPANIDSTSYYNPFDPTKTSLESDNGYTILPASTDWTTDYLNNLDDLTMAKGGSYSIKVDANKVFTNLERVLPDMYDEYVFEVQFSTAGSVTTINCPDANCYEIVAKVEKYIDGCDDGGTGCTQIGTGGTNSDGYHIYPDDFDANVVRAWDTYPYEKLGIDIRNKTGNGFDLVLKVPRLKRIGLIDVYADSDGNFRQLALDWLADYHAHDWDDTTVAQPEGTSDTNNHPPDYTDMYINMHTNNPTNGGSAAAFSLETAVQFIRLGIPANIRVSFYTVTTPQTNLFEG